MSLGITQADYQYMRNQQQTSIKPSQRKYATQSVGYTQQPQKVKETESDNDCTDGKDDGKIGFFSAIGHAVKGAVKGIVNGVKSCFTDKEGNFSIGKTLLTVGVAALSIVCPPVGVAACAIGAVSGAVTLGKGIYKAATADTDAEAKDAWEEIGDGAFTTVSCAVGAKAGVSAIKNSSSAGAIDDVAKSLSQLDNVDDAAKAAGNLKKVNNIDDVLKNVDKADDLAKALKNNNLDDAARILKESPELAASIGEELGQSGKISALDALKVKNPEATRMDKLKALGKDSLSSTKNNFKTAKTKVSNWNDKHTQQKDIKSFGENTKKIKELEGKESLSTSEKTQLENLRKTNENLQKKYTENGEKILDLEKETANFKSRSEIKAASKETRNKAKESIKSDKKYAKELKESNLDEEQLAELLKATEENIKENKQLYKDNTFLGSVKNKAKAQGAEIKDGLGLGDFKSETSSTFKTIKNEATANGTTKNPLEIVKNIRNSDEATMGKVFGSLSKDTKAIIAALRDETTRYSEVVELYGYDNVMHALIAFQGVHVGSEAV